MNVLFFGQIADITGNTDLQVEDVADTATLIKKLQTNYPALSNSKFAVAVNKKIILGNTELQKDFEVALLPPFSGG